MKNLGLIQVLKEQDEITQSTKQIKHDSMFSGDFDSDASKQSWFEFLSIYITVGPGAAMIRELSSWHGEIESKEYPRHFAGQKIKLPVTYKISLINEGTKASDFLEGVKSDDNGEYYEYETGLKQNLNFYLPNSDFFKRYSNVPYKFETEEGYVYTLLLELSSKKTTQELQLGSDSSEDDMTISLKNLNPSGGNGWFLSLPPDLNGYLFEYYRKVGSKLIPFNYSILQQSVKSSFELFWDKWGVVIQIVGSVILAYFTAGLSAFIEGVFLTLAEAEMLAARGAGIFQSIYTWLSASGSFTAARSTIMAMFLLETAINVPSAFIDLYYDNKFACILGIVFCFFPVISQYGKLGRFIEGGYSKAAVDSILNKLLSSGLNSSSSEKVLYDFIVSLTAEEKLMFSQAMKVLGSKEGNEALKESLQQAMKTAAKNGEAMKGFQKWLKVGVGSGLFKNAIVGGVFFGLTAGVYVALEKLIKEKSDPRSKDDVLKDAEISVGRYTKKLEQVDKSRLVQTTSTEDIIEQKLKNSSVDVSAQYIYTLSKEDGINKDFLNYICEIKMNEYKTHLFIQKSLKPTIENVQEIITELNIINDGLINPIPEEELFTWIENEDTKTDVIQFLSTYSKDPMTKQISEAVNKFRCLSQRFKYVDGYDLLNDWLLVFEVTKNIRIKTGNDKKIKLDLLPGEKIYIRSNGDFTYKNIDYTGFSC